MKVRGFEAVLDNEYKDIILPKRGTQASAGYDFYLNHDVLIKPNDIVKIKTNVKAYMQEDEYLEIYIRSSLGIKGLFILNTVGIIDSDYYSNPSNDGNIIVTLKNISNETISLSKGDKVVQGIFKKYLLADQDDAKASRSGGFGSTNN